jgi:hypothetical protein
MKDVILIDLQENNLHSLNEYIKAINAVVNVPSMQQYIQKEYIIPVVADWPGQIYLRTAISRFQCWAICPIGHLDTQLDIQLDICPQCPINYLDI